MLSVKDKARLVRTPIKEGPKHFIINSRPTLKCLRQVNLNSN